MPVAAQAGIAAAMVAGATLLAAAPSPPPAPANETVATGAPRQFGEPATAGSAVPVVAATAFDAGSVVRTWSRETAGWVAGPSLLPAGYAQSYDPAAAVLPDGRSLLVVGAARAGACIDGGGLALAAVSAGGAVGPARMVNAPASGFDDRPAVAAGAGGAVWLGWSHGEDADACQPVGADDVVQVTRSTDGGATFGPVWTLPSVTGGGAFGVRIAPLPHGEALAAWVESTAATDALVVASLGPDGLLTGPQVIARAPAAPLVLPESSFYTFVTPSVTALPDGRASLAWTPWDGVRSALSVLVGRVGGGWTATTVPPPAGVDLLEPDCAAAGGGLWCLAAEHRRETDAVGYGLVSVDVTGERPTAGSLTEVAAGLPGPGYFEFGEETQLSRWRTRLSAAAVLAGRTGSTLTWWSWSLPATPRGSAHPKTHPPTRGRPVAAATGPPVAALLAGGLTGLVALAAAVLGTRRRRARGGTTGPR